MTTVHKQYTIYANAEWTIIGTIYKRNRALEDLDGAVVEWILTDAAGEQVIAPDDVTVVINLDELDASDGTCTITVPASANAALSSGHYQDALRITSATIPRGIYWYGPLIVKALPFPLV